MEMHLLVWPIALFKPKKLILGIIQWLKQSPFHVHEYLFKHVQNNLSFTLVVSGRHRSRREIKENIKEKTKDREALLPSAIKNKEKRSAVPAKLKQQKKVEKRNKAKAREAVEQRALELGEEPPARPTPRTIENTRQVDETVCKPDDEELFAGNDADEFSFILKEERPPKRGPAFIRDILSVIPNAHYHKRGTYDLKKALELPSFLLMFFLV